MSLGFILDCCSAVGLSYVIVSFYEHQAHQHVMHKCRLPAPVYRCVPYLLRVFRAHAVEHHARYYREFDFEPDAFGREYNLEISIGATGAMFLSYLPLWLLLLHLFPLCAMTLLVFHVLHDRIWSVFHRQMHVPRDACFRKWRVYRFLARYHYMHHRKPNRNYNVICPLADLLLGTLARPTFADVRAMLILELLEPRSAPARRQITRRREEIRKARNSLLGSVEQR